MSEFLPEPADAVEDAAGAAAAPQALARQRDVGLLREHPGVQLLQEARQLACATQRRTV